MKAPSISLKRSTLTYNKAVSKVKTGFLYSRQYVVAKDLGKKLALKIRVFVDVTEYINKLTAMGKAESPMELIA